MIVRRFALLVLLLVASRAYAQPGQNHLPMPAGVVWEQPFGYDAAAADLRHLAGLGVRVLRTLPVTDDRLLTLADSLGLTFYQELPALYLSGDGMTRALPRLQAALNNLMARSAGHPSGRVVGLARMPDTSDPRTCAALQRLADQARDQRADVRFYYLTVLSAHDTCANTVDFVLLPALDAARPLEVLARWHAGHPQVPAGLVVGWWSDPAQRGRRAPHSPEAAALRLDTLLATLPRAGADAQPAVLFVYRWRDEARSPLGLHAPHRGHYGLLAPEGYVNPAYEVVEGRFTGTQDVFALRGGGETQRSPANALRLLAWAILLLLGIGMAAEPRFRQMAQRYFSARGFYRESVRDARGALLGTTLVLLVALGVSVGLVATVVMTALSASPALPYAAAHLDEASYTLLGALLAAPWRFVLVFALVFALFQVVTAIAYALAVRRRYPLSPTQTLALGLWSRWPFLPLAFAALVTQTLPAPWVLRGALVVGALALALSLYATVRTLIDLVAITRVPGYVALALLLLHPVALGALVVLVVWFDYGAALRYFALLVPEGIG